MLDAEAVEDHGLEADHVADRDLRECSAVGRTGCVIDRGRAGRTGASAQHVHRDDVGDGGVEQPAGPEQPGPPVVRVGVPREGMADQRGVRPVTAPRSDLDAHVAVVSLKPSPKAVLRRLSSRIEETAIQKRFRGRISTLDHWRAGIKRRQSIAQPGVVAVFFKIGFCQHDPVGNRHLLHCFFVCIEGRSTVDRVHHRHHAIEPIAQHQIGMQHDRMQHRCRIGKAGGFDDDP